MVTLPPILKIPCSEMQVGLHLKYRSVNSTEFIPTVPPQSSIPRKANGTFMTVLRQIELHSAQTEPHPQQASSLYHTGLNGGQADQSALRRFLQNHLETVSDAECELPPSVADWPSWVAEHASQVGEEYAEYLEQRHAGAPRRFFTNKAHALYFLQHVAPSKLVDGAWLHSATKHPSDWRYHSLIRTYLEELGDGDPALNHVVLYRNLLAEHDCAPEESLPDDRYIQGALQLALGHLGEEFLPEVIGYNLGYEQLPLHLLITAFELNELGIDPYYFTLHVTIDNASSGHAKKAVETVNQFLTSAPDAESFLTRLRNGYKLNDLGVGTVAVIDSFDLEREVVAMLENKRSFGQHMHSDYCRLEGRTVNEWLSEPGQSREFLAVLENKGWIKRDQDPALSRFWQLIDGPGAVMFGVFNGYEKQLICDWIAGNWQVQQKESQPFRSQFRRRPQATVVNADKGLAAPYSLEMMVDLMSPSRHHTPVGMEATKIYSSQLARGLFQ